MSTFDEYQARAKQAPASLRNDRERVNLPVLGLQEEAGKIGALLASAFAPGRLELTTAQREELKDRLADTLWYVASLCSEAGLSMRDVAAHSITQLQARLGGLDPDRR